MSMDLTRLPPTTGRVYATTRGQAAKTSGTITGILCIDDRTAFALFDTGATHSIISTTFAKKLNMTPTSLIERIIISTPMKNHTLIDHEYVNCPLRFDDRIRPANLLPIHMTVIFGNVRQPEFVYHGSSPLKSVKLISAMKARTLISHGCQGFLASVMNTSLESPNIENLSVVREFTDVFLDELPGLPPAREIKFGIELIPSAEPISKAPYRMAPVELKELKEQLQEMLENGFIRPSMVNTRTDADLSAAVQNALQTLLPQIHAEIREEFRTSSGPSDADFKKLFFLQFFPRAEQERLKREYHSIRQTSTETSTEFMQRFLRLAGFLGTAAGTEEEQAKNFINLFSRHLFMNMILTPL
nr:putative reverse transcriptase domain-containing protein [Tanacetum cinerariifolium]